MELGPVNSTPTPVGSPPCATCAVQYLLDTDSAPYRGVFNCSPGYDSLRHCLKCSARRWMCPPALCGHRQRNGAPTSASDRTYFSPWPGPHVLPEEIQGGVAPTSGRGSVSPPPTFSIPVWEGLGYHADACLYHRFSMAYTQQGSAPPVEGSRNAPIPFYDSSARLWESDMRDQQTALVIPLTSLRMSQELRHMAAFL